MQSMLNNPAGSDVVIYDDHCAFCIRQMDGVRRRDRQGRFAFAGWHSPGLLERFPMLAGEDFQSGMRLVEPDGRVSKGADAVYEIARRLPYWRRWAWLYHVPGLHAIYRTIYAWIARNRMKLGASCADGACKTQPES